MKRLFISSVLAFTFLLGSAQVMHIFHDGNTIPDVIANAGIDSIYYVPKFLGSTEFQQVFVTKDGVKYYDMVDSVKFNMPGYALPRHSYYVPNDYGCILIIAYGAKESSFITDENGNQISRWPFNEARVIWSRYVDYNNEDGHSIPHKEKWILTNGDIKDTLTINYTVLPFANNKIGQICFPVEGVDYVIDTNLPDPSVTLSLRNPDDTETFETGGIYAFKNAEGKLVIHIPRNESGMKKQINMSLYAGGYYIPVNWFTILDQLGEPFKHTSEEHMKALQEFCDSTDFVKWGAKLNWWGDDPLWNWDLNVNNDDLGYCYYMDGHIVNMDLSQYNRSPIYNPVDVSGTLPASFEVFMDDAQGSIALDGCSLHGKIPYNIRHHERWPEFGWRFIVQKPAGFDMDDINLRMSDEEITYADGSKGTAYEELAKHQLTLVSIGEPSVAIANICLDYANKGFEYVFTAQDWLAPTTLLDVQRAANKYKEIPNVLLCYKSWLNGELGFGMGAIGSTFLLDSKGNVVDYVLRDWGIDEAYYADRLRNILLKYLAEPEEHDPYEPKPIYTSTDYSRDGEVLTLQKATIGKGIDLVFMGDMYVDTLLVDGGKYELDMQASMEYFFEVEPYKSLRNRFNVYAVKAVSPQGAEGSEHKFNYDNGLVFDYAKKVPDIDMEHVAVTVIRNDGNIFFSSGETAMWESGSSIA